MSEEIEKIQKSDEEWADQLSELAYQVTRERGTEEPFTGAYHDQKQPGTYNCICCGLPLFDSDTKYDSGTGWPSFFAPTSENHIQLAEDTREGRVRTEVLCNRCDAHLGHVFRDGPPPTGLRYCINSAALDFEADDE